MPIRLDLAPGRDLGDEMIRAKGGTRRSLLSELGQRVPRRLAEVWLRSTPTLASRPMAEQRDRDLQQLADQLQRWELRPQGTEGYRKAEVTAGGVATEELSSQSMESRRVDGLHFIGEVVDVTGWLGGYNFQWAWASAAACARSL
jgi:predicted flavoprotein YhiN